MAEKLCKICNKSVNRKNPGLQCGSFCARFYHGQCISIVGNQLDSLRAEGVSWTCPCCRGRPRTSVVAGKSLLPQSPQVNDAATSDSAAAIALEEIRLELKQILEQQDMVLQSVNFCSNKISDFENEISILREYVKKTDELAKENRRMKSDIDSIQSKWNDLEQVSRLNNIEIQGIPEKNDILDSAVLDTSHYNVFRRDRESAPCANNKKSGGGVLIGVKNSISVKHREHLQSDAEDLWVTIHNDNNLKIHVCCVYLSPRYDYARLCFTSKLQANLDELTAAPKTMRINPYIAMMIDPGDFINFLILYMGHSFNNEQIHTLPYIHRLLLERVQQP
ncbi:hypothetical protein JTB14_029926 [Gonioctena quinquepunctata]|nr:hypothetical protein JTB14_029926 [Gonioctena quinquepunctata]